MRFLCINCWHIYDESLWEVDDNIEPGTCIDEISQEIHCPSCDGSFEDFSPIEDEVIYAENPEHLSHIEREHMPRIMHLDAHKVEVCVGEEEEMHSSSEEHRVTAIYLVDEEGHIVEEIFIMAFEDPVAEFDISGLDDFEIRASCNQHGLWGSWLINVEEYLKEHPEESDEDL